MQLIKEAQKHLIVTIKNRNKVSKKGLSQQLVRSGCFFL